MTPPTTLTIIKIVSCVLYFSTLYILEVDMPRRPRSSSQRRTTLGAANTTSTKVPIVPERVGQMVEFTDTCALGSAGHQSQDTCQTDSGPKAEPVLPTEPDKERHSVDLDDVTTDSSFISLCTVDSTLW